MEDTVDRYETRILTHQHLGRAILRISLFARVGDLWGGRCEQWASRVQIQGHSILGEDSLERKDLALSLLETMEAFEAVQFINQEYFRERDGGDKSRLARFDEDNFERSLACR